MNLYAVMPLGSVLAYGVLLYHATRHPRRRERRAFAFYLGAAGCWSIFSFVLHIDEPLLNRYALAESRFLIVSFTLMVVAYYSFLRVYVDRDPGPGLYLASASVPLMGALAGLGWLPEDAHTESGVLYIEHGWTLYLLAGTSMAMVVHGIYMLARHYRSSLDPMTRTRTTYLLIGVSVLTVGGLTNLNDALVRYPVDHVGNLFNALVISYAIRKYQLLEIRIVIRRGLIYSASSVTLVVAYLLLLFGFHKTFLDLTDNSSLFLAALLALALALLAAPLRSLAEEQVDRLFFRDLHRYRKLILDFSTETSGVLELERLARVTLQTTAGAVQARWAGMLFQDPSSGDYTLQFSEGDLPSHDTVDLRLRREDPILKWFAAERRPIRSETLEVLPAARRYLQKVCKQSGGVPSL